jgi:hypothetical protein
MTQLAHMDAQLVGATGYRFEQQAGTVGLAPQYFKVGEG